MHRAPVEPRFAPCRVSLALLCLAISSAAPGRASADPLLVPAPPPESPRLVTELVWPVLETLPPTAGWSPTLIDLPLPSIPEDWARTRAAAGALWASLDATGTAVVVCVYRGVDDRVLRARIPFDPDLLANFDDPAVPLTAARRRAADALGDTVRLRAEFLLAAPIAPPSAVPTTSPEPPPPWMAGAPSLPPERLADLSLPPPILPPAPPHVVVPNPPPALPRRRHVQTGDMRVFAESDARVPVRTYSRTAETAVRDEAIPAPTPSPTDGPPVRAWAGATAIADLDHVEPGVGAGLALPITPGIWGRVDADAAVLSRDETGDGRAFYSLFRLGLGVEWPAIESEARSVALHAGLGVDHLSVGGDTTAAIDDSEWRFGAQGGAALRWRLARPFEAGLDATITARQAAYEVRLGDATLHRHGAVQLQLSAYIGWAMPTLP